MCLFSFHLSFAETVMPESHTSHKIWLAMAATPTARGLTHFFLQLLLLIVLRPEQLPSQI